MPSDLPRREFLIRLTSVSATIAAGAALSACGGADEREVRFDFGVASGDPQADRVILWTHARYADIDAPVELTWEVAQDASFSPVLATGQVTAGAATGHTAKVDATGLAAGRDYVYRFRVDRKSVV